MKTVINTEHNEAQYTNQQYDKWLDTIKVAAAKKLARGAKVFRTSATPEALWQAYIYNIPFQLQQEHTCTACRNFIENFGGLVVLDGRDRVISLLWEGLDEVPDLYYKSAVALRNLVVNDSAINGTFHPSSSQLGIPENRAGLGVTWKHLSLKVPFSMVSSDSFQKEAQDKENFKTLSRAMKNWSFDLINKAIGILRNDEFLGSQKYLEWLNWLSDLRLICQKKEKTGGHYNTIWDHVHSAPTGWCSPRSSVLGMLIDGIETGDTIAHIKQEWNRAVAPENFQRPTAAPTEGNLAAAEKTISSMGYELSLKRKYATLKEIHTLWKPFQKGGEDHGVFGHLRKSNNPPNYQGSTKGRVMSWVKFAREILPTVAELRLLVPRVGSFTGLLTATHPEAPCIMRWGNHCSWYLYSNGSPGVMAHHWGLKEGIYYRVAKICSNPSMWDNDPEAYNEFEGLIFLISGMRDNNPNLGLGLFPQILRKELFPYRSTIEAHSNSKNPDESSDGTRAAGLSFRKSNEKWNLNLRVTDFKGIINDYSIDRWE